MDGVIDEQRKRREFLYYIYRAAQHYNSGAAGLFPMNYADTMGVYQDMRHWGPKGNEVYALLLYYHLSEGHISVTSPHPDGGIDEKAFSYDAWQHPLSVFPKQIFITPKGMRAVENDHELLACLIHDGAAVDWSKADIATTQHSKPVNQDTAVPTPNDSTLTPKELKYRSELLKILKRHFDDNDLKMLYFDLGWEYGDFEYGGKNAQALALVKECFHTARQGELVNLITQYRPKVEVPKPPE
jgi:hypothetical protein